MTSPPVPPGTDRTARFEEFTDFALALAELVEADGTGWSPDDLLVDRLDWDSLAIAEVVSWLADHLVHLPEGLIGELRTVGDLYHYVTAPGTRITRTEEPGVPVTLEPVRHQDEAELFDLFIRGDALTRFRLRGITPSPESFHAQLWERVLAQFTVRTQPGGPILGLVTAYEPDLRNQHVHVAAISGPDAAGTGSVARGTFAFVDYLFSTFPLRKIYAETLSGNLEQFSSGIGRYFEIEGRLRDHEYVDGAYQDMIILATTRQRWQAKGARPAGWVAEPGSPSGPVEKFL